MAPTWHGHDSQKMRTGGWQVAAMWVAGAYLVANFKEIIPRLIYK